VCIDAQRKKYTMKTASKLSTAAQLTLDDLCNCIFDVIFQNILYVKTAAVINAGEDDRSPTLPLNEIPLQLIGHRGVPLDKSDLPSSLP
jgi:hypothetical protein